VVLRGLREYRQRRLPGWERIDLSTITPIVSFSDDGGSSGRLVRTYGTLPPGDLRNCLLALADPSLEPLMTQFFNHRFSADEGEALSGHSAGNLLIVAIAQLHGGDVRKAILDIRRLLGIEGRITFPTLAPAVLCAELTDGTIVVGESAIANRINPSRIGRVFFARRDDPNPRPGQAPPLPAMSEAIQAIDEADAIVMGPGSLYSSVIANLLVPDVAAAVRRTRGAKIYVANLMVEPGETDDFSLARHLEAIREHGKIEVDFVIANNAAIDPVFVRLYASERLERELEMLQGSLEEAAKAIAPSEAGVDEVLLGQRVARMQALLDSLRCPDADRGQVLPREEEERIQPTKLVCADVIRVEEQIRDGETYKRVLRHDPERLVETILQILETIEQDAA
jgi:uncharacterized cofD-like protein